MEAGTSHRLWVLGSIFFLGLAAAAPARAEDVDSPQYGAWAKFKPESSSTLAADIKMGAGNSFHIETTMTLKSVTAQQVEVEATGKVNIMGQDRTTPPQTRTIPAKETKQDRKDLGEQDVQAMGKTFKCKVYEITGGGASGLAPSPRGPAAGGANPNAKATLYVNDDVPGGVVKMDVSSGPGGQAMSFTLTAMDVK